jgi:transposase
MSDDVSMALSLDIKQRIATDLSEGKLTFQQIAERYRVGKTTVYRVSVKVKKQLPLAHATSPGRPGKVAPDQWEAFEAMANSIPDFTPHTLAQAWNEAGHAPISSHTARRILRKLLYAFKKNPESPPNATRPSEPPSAR